MSVLSRLRRAFRSENWQRLYDYDSDSTTPLAFTSDLVTGEYTNKNEPTNLLKVAWEDPIGHRICILLSTNVFDDWFIIKKKSDDPLEEEKEHPQNQQIQEEFLRMNAKYHFTQALIGERIFGRSFLIYNYNIHRDEVELGYQVATLDVFTDENMQILQESYDLESGEPEYITVRPNAAYESVTDRIPWADLTMWCTRPKGRSYDGYSAMYAVWDLMTYLREGIDSAVWMIKKYGIGVWLWYVRGGASSELIDSLQDTLQNMSGKRAVVVETDKFEKVDWSGPPPSGTTSTIEISDYILGMISAGSGIPKDIYTGVSAGAITGSEINNKALYATINKIQSDVTPFVLEAITRMGYDVSDMIIEWNTRYATDELEQAQVRQMNADALIKEKQAERGDIAINVTGLGGGGNPKDPNKNNNPTGAQA
jgi:hypothetical protein